jgi:hypothetical protein
MARLAKIEIAIQSFRVTERTLNSLGPIADEIARAAARQVYDIDVKVDVVLREGSLIVKITVAGSILLGSYHAVAVYPEFKKGIVQLSEDAQIFGAYVADHFVKAIEIPKSQIRKIKKSDETPGRIKNLMSRLENLGEQFPNMSVERREREFRRAGHELGLIMKSLGAEERETVLNSLKITNLPPVSDWPKYPEPPRIARREEGLLIGRETVRDLKPKKKKLRYHNSFVVHGSQ